MKLTVIAVLLIFVIALITAFSLFLFSPAGYLFRTPPQTPEKTTHFECVNNACLSIAGFGDDQCTRNADCFEKEKNTHLECVGSSCTSVAGAGSDTCLSDLDCQAPTHLACIDFSCQIVNGSGTDDCSTDSDCSHLECVDLACEPVAGAGTDLCLTDTDCQQNETHLACIGDACAVVEGPGTDECLTDSDCQNERLPDLIVSSLSVSTNGSNSSSVTLIATLMNKGSAPADLSMTDFFVSPRGGEQIKNTPSLAPGQSTTITADYTLTQGTYLAVVTADWFKTIIESNEDNNVRQLNFTV